MMRDWRGAVVRLIATESQAGQQVDTHIGSAFLIDTKLLVTCSHVVDDAINKAIYASGPAWSGRQLAIRVVRHPVRDISLIEVADDLDLLVAPLPRWDGKNIAINESTVTVAGYATSAGALETPKLTLRSYDGTLNTWMLHTHISRGLSGGPAIIDGCVAGVVQAREIDGGKCYVIPMSALEEFLAGNVKNGSVKRLVVRNQAPSPPVGFVGRLGILQRIRSKLSADDVRAVCLKGMGGVGKTAIAQALGWDPDIHRLFPDGVLWTTIGQAPNVLSCLHEVLLPLEKTTVQYSSVAIASAQLRTLLSGGKFLIIVNDVWSFEDVEPFLVGGPQCRLVFTARDKYVADAAKATLIEIEVLARDAAIALLRERLPSDFKHSIGDEELGQLADLVGSLPFALEIIAMHLTDGISAEVLIDQLSTEIGKLQALAVGTDDELSQRLSLDATLTLSFRTLRPNALRALLLLSLLRPQGQISLLAAAALIDCSSFETRKLLALLSAKSLLVAEKTEEDDTVYRMHDLVRDKCRTMLFGTKYEDSLPEGVPRFEGGDRGARFVVDQIRRYRGNAPWSSLGGDQYLSRNLFFHLIEAGEEAAVFEVLEEDAMSVEEVTVKNAWLSCQERLGSPHLFLSDVELAWSSAEKTFRSSVEQNAGRLSQQATIGLARALRAGFLTASVISQNVNIPIRLVELLREHEVWSPGQALYSVGRSLKPFDLPDFVCRLPEPQKSHGFALALARLSQMFLRFEPKHVMPALAATMFLSSGRSREVTRRTIRDLRLSPKGRSAKASVGELQLIQYAIGELEKVRVRLALFEALVEFLRARIIWALAPGSRSSSNRILTRTYCRLLSEVLENYLWRTRNTSYVDLTVQMLIGYRTSLEDDLLAAAEGGYVSLAQLLPPEYLASLFDRTFDEIHDASLWWDRMSMLGGDDAEKSRLNLSRLVRILICCAFACDSERLRRLAEYLSRNFERSRTDIRILLALLSSDDQRVAVISVCWPTAPYLDKLAFASSLLDRGRRESLSSEAVDELATLRARDNQANILKIATDYFPALHFNSKRKFVGILKSIPYSSAVASAVVQCYNALDVAEKVHFYRMAAEIGDPFGLFLLGCARSFEGNKSVGAGSIRSLVEVLRSIQHRDGVVRAVIDAVSFIKMPRTVCAEYLEIAVESARGITDDEPVFEAFVGVATMTDPGTSSKFVSASPIMNGVHGIVVSEKQRRQCVSVRLRDLLPDEFQPYCLAEGIEVSNLPIEYLGDLRNLDDVALAAELLQQVREIVDTESRSDLYRKVTPIVRELAIRGYGVIALEAACAIHDCYRWWR